ncbi:MAG TPA: S41 family peptidase [Aquaticitalea sp.]|nr:S41 family peptidase [Aquaticitalea sp.]
MKRKFLIIALSISLTSCFEDADDNAIDPINIKDFVWKGLNAIYLYKDQIPNLADNRFASEQEYTSFLNGYTSPETLFESLMYQRQTVDRFSLIHNNYIALEQQLTGTTVTDGLRYYAFAPPNNPSNRVLVIRQVLKGSNADNLGLQRGQFITQIDGTTITASNVNALLEGNSHTLHFADYNDSGTPQFDDDTFIPNGITVTVNKAAFTQNPVQQTEIFDVDGEKVGYMLYNAFNPDFEVHLNNAFAQFQSNNIQHLVIDLRYNGGGSINTARLLGSMVTGQFNGQVFSKLVYNSDLQELNTDYVFLDNFGGNTINSLNLNKVYVLTTSGSASASELIINSLSAYIDVVQVGDVTTGKTQASILIYDSPDFSANNRNPSHTYVMLPLIANSVNVNGQPVPSTGLVPDISITESVVNLGHFGNPDEPLLAAALADIRGEGRLSASGTTSIFQVKTETNVDRFEKVMYLDKHNFQ